VGGLSHDGFEHRPISTFFAALFANRLGFKWFLECQCQSVLRIRFGALIRSQFRAAKKRILNYDKIFGPQGCFEVALGHAMIFPDAERYPPNEKLQTGFSCHSIGPSDLQQHDQKQYQQNQSQSAAGVVAPSSAVGPCRQYR
jgi:hypothetical protein